MAWRLAMFDSTINDLDILLFMEFVVCTYWCLFCFICYTIWLLWLFAWLNISWSFVGLLFFFVALIVLGTRFPGIWILITFVFDCLWLWLLYVFGDCTLCLFEFWLFYVVFWLHLVNFVLCLFGGCFFILCFVLVFDFCCCLWCFCYLFWYLVFDFVDTCFVLWWFFSYWFAFVTLLLCVWICD